MVARLLIQWQGREPRHGRWSLVPVPHKPWSKHRQKNHTSICASN